MSLTRVAALAFAAALTSPGYAFNRCTDAKGKVTYQDAPCEAGQAKASVDTSNAVDVRPGRAPSPGPAAVQTNPSSGDYTSARGAWRGPAQFQLFLAGQTDLNAQRVVRMVVEIHADGKVLGTTEAGCSLSGLASQFVGPASVALDVTLKGCIDVRFNSRMTGHLVANPGAREAKFSLNALTQTALKFQQTSIDAVLRR